MTTSTETHNGGIAAVQLQILDEFRRICELEHLRWWVVGGTLLGAIRHRGFIPWDDDIDVAMPRPDYDRWVELARDRALAPYFWESLETNPAYPLPFGKLMDRRTILVEREFAHLPLCHGVYIDVFPLDGAPEGRLAQRLHGGLLRLARFRLAATVRTSGSKRALAVAARLAPRSIAVSLLRILANRYPFCGSKFVVNGGGAWGYRRECVQAEWFRVAAPVLFEGRELPGPSEPDAYLAQVYGNYMQLPACQDRVSHHHILHLDLPDHAAVPLTTT